MISVIFTLYQGYMMYYAPFLYGSFSGSSYGIYAILYDRKSSLELDFHSTDTDDRTYTFTSVINYRLFRFGLSYTSYNTLLLISGFRYGNFSGNFYIYDVNKYLHLSYVHLWKGSSLGLQLNLSYTDKLYTALWLNLSFYDLKKLFSVFVKLGSESYPVRNNGFYVLDFPQDSLRTTAFGIHFKYLLNEHFAIYITGILERLSRRSFYRALSLSLGFSP